MTLTADQAAAVRATCDAVNKNIDQHSKDFFIFYLKQNPGDQAKFPNYKGKPIDSLPGVSQFPRHVKNVVADALDHFYKAGDAGALAAKGKATVEDHVSRKVGHKEFANILGSLTAYLQQQLGGSFNSGAWDAATHDVLSVLQ